MELLFLLLLFLHVVFFVVLKRLAKIDILCHLHWFILIYLGRRTHRPKKKKRFVISTANDLSVVFFIFCQAGLFWKIRWWMGTKSRNGQNVSCSNLFPVKTLWACPLSHWCSCQVAQLAQTSNQSCHTYRRKWCGL